MAKVEVRSKAKIWSSNYFWYLKFPDSDETWVAVTFSECVEAFNKGMTQAHG